MRRLVMLIRDIFTRYEGSRSQAWTEIRKQASQ